MSREMKDSGIPYIGQIPTNWEIVPIKSRYNFYTGFTPPTGEERYYDPDGEMWVTIADMRDTVIDKSEKHITKTYAEQKGKKMPAGSLLYSFKLSVGKTALLGCDSYTNEAIAAFPETDNPCINYLRYSSMFIEGNANENIYGAKILNQKLINSAPMPFPPLPEQQAIVRYLDSKCSAIDEAIERHKKIIEKLEEYREATITEAVTQGISKQPLKESGYDVIGRIPQHWMVIRLRFIGYPMNGISKSGDSFGKGYPFVSYGDVYKNITLPEKVTGLVETTEEERLRYSVQAGDIFFTRTSETIDEVGFSSVCEKTIPDATFAGFLIRVRPYNDTLDSSYAKYYFRGKHLRNYFAREMDITTRASLSQNFLKNVPVLVPPKDEQQMIARFLDDVCGRITCSIEKQESIITKLEEYRKSIIYNAVTGKIDCREVAE